MQTLIVKSPDLGILNLFGELEIEKGLKSFSILNEHSFEFYDKVGQKMAKLNLPLRFSSVVDHCSIQDYAQIAQIIDGKFCVILIQAGEAVLGVVSNNELEKYKLIRKYMVRKKQGKMQLKHLNTKGKSKAGSRIRLAQSVVFFEEINELLKSWTIENPFDLIVYGISQTLLPFWKSSNEPIPFTLNDVNVRKVNWSVATPRQIELVKSIAHINSARISIFDTVLCSEIKAKLEQFNIIYRQNP